jgi:hypothetical protein
MAVSTNQRRQRTGILEMIRNVQEFAEASHHTAFEELNEEGGG